MIYFGLLSMMLSQFYDSDHMFYELTYVDRDRFIVLCF
jgi:hypothetical protein